MHRTRWIPARRVRQTVVRRRITCYAGEDFALACPSITHSRTHPGRIGSCVGSRVARFGHIDVIQATRSGGAGMGVPWLARRLWRGFWDRQSLGRIVIKFYPERNEASVTVSPSLAAVSRRYWHWLYLQHLAESLAL